MCRDNPSVSNSNEVAMMLHLMRAKLMWKLVSLNSPTCIIRHNLTITGNNETKQRNVEVASIRKVLT